MAYRGTSHRGTPYRHVDAKGGEGQRGASPPGRDGTSLSQFGSEKGGYRDEHAKGHGTPYDSRAGNPPGARREVGDHPMYGQVTSEHGIDHNDPRDNGKGVVLDGANRYEAGYMPKAEPPLDSPVPNDAPWFEARTVQEEDRAHLGVGKGGAENAGDNILELGGVLSRGQVGSSSRSGPETELLQDDEGGLHGHATQSQPRGGVKHLKE